MRLHFFFFSKKSVFFGEKNKQHGPAVHLSHHYLKPQIVGWCGYVPRERESVLSLWEPIRTICLFSFIHSMNPEQTNKHVAIQNHQVPQTSNPKEKHPFEDNRRNIHVRITCFFKSEKCLKQCWHHSNACQPWGVRFAESVLCFGIMQIMRSNSWPVISLER